MNRQWDIDTSIIFTLPLILGLAVLTMPHESLFFFAGVVAVLYLYEFIIFDRRRVFGFSGLKLLTIPSILLLGYTVIIAAPSIYVCYKHINDTAIYPYFYTVISFYPLYGIGLRLADLYWKIDYERIYALSDSEFQKSKIDPFIVEFLFFLFVVGMGVYVIYLSRLEAIPVVELLSKTEAAATYSLLREESFKLLKVSIFEKYLVLWQRSVILPVGIIISLFFYLLYKQKRFLWWFVIFLLAGLSFNILTLEKSPTASIIMSIMAVYFLRQRTFKLKFVLLSVLMVFSIPILIIYLKYRAEDLKLASFVFTSLLERLFIIPTEVLYYHFVIFPEKVDFLMGQSTQLFSWIHPQGHIMLPVFVARIITGNPKTFLYYNALYLGNFWADFGWVGVILSTILLGVFIHWLFYKTLVVSRYQKNVVYILICAITMPIFTFLFLSVNITVVLISNGILLLAFFITFIHRTLNRKLYPAVEKA